MRATGLSVRLSSFTHCKINNVCSFSFIIFGAVLCCCCCCFFFNCRKVLVVYFSYNVMKSTDRQTSSCLLMTDGILLCLTLFLTPCIKFICGHFSGFPALRSVLCIGGTSVKDQMETIKRLVDKIYL